MKRFFIAQIVLAMMCAGQGFPQSSSWTFVKVFPDTNFVSPYGVHGLAVAPDGNIWIAPSWATDSVMDAGGVWWPVVQIFVFHPDGTPASFSGFKFITVGSVHDTLFNGTGGMRTDADGNVVYAAYDSYWRIDYRTGEGLAKVVPHAGDYVVAPAFTGANEMFTADILPGNPIRLFNSNFDFLGTVVTSSEGFSRAFEVSKDGNDIYWAGYTLNKVLIYHSDVGTIGSYALQDSMAPGFQAESFAWNRGNGHLYMSGGNVDTADYGPFLPGHAPMQWVGFDPATKAGTDTITWNWNAYPYLRTAGESPRPRVIDFSVSGDTAYVGGFWQDKAAVQMFKRINTGVSSERSAIPIHFELSQNYPNPFNPSTTIRYGLPHSSFVQLTVYNILGQRVATLVYAGQEAGYHEVQFDGSGLASGVYFYKLQAGTFVEARKLLLTR